MRLGSSAVCRGFDTYSLRFRSRLTHDRPVFVEGRARQIETQSPSAHEPFDEPRSIIDYL
jgi:hypothetical protein